ncbi:MAG: 50S ribosomal protein L10 [Ilumatobacteraceae bacterium]|jgi:large subunit ribosomal protein L10
MTTENPRAEKVAVVEEVTAKLNSAQAAIITEYRGMSVGQLATLRKQLRNSGGEYKVYKNTLARFGAANAGLDGLAELLIGPSAITFVSGDAAGVAKALKDAAKTNPFLIIKGGTIAGKTMSASDIEALADLPSRDVLLSMLAGAFQAPLVKTASLLQALPRNFAYGLKALIEQREAA